MEKPELILIRGLPGSGKSTIAETFKRHYHFESDQYWGEDYNFDIDKLQNAHRWCQARVNLYLNKLNDLFCKFPNSIHTKIGIVVSNTFTTKNELLPYFEIASEFGIIPNVLLCQSNFGSIHNVPQETIEKMKNRFEYDIQELYNE